MKILCTGDVHIGRRSSRLPPGKDSQSHSSAAAWLRIVDTAIADSVDLVAVSGDLVDQANRFFEAFGPLEAGLRRLAAEGIETVLVAGNHDFDVLPRIVDGLGGEKVHLLGRKGEWERRTFERAGVRLHVDGWSFTTEHQPRSPLATYHLPTDGTPVLAIVHGDVEQPRSSYAPISLADLRRHPDAFFLLGHIHDTRSWNEPGGARALYPGSPQAMDPGETGAHGVHIVTVNPEGFDSRHLPLSSVRYESLEIPVEGIDRLEAVDEAVVVAIRQAVQGYSGDSHLRHLRLRLRLTGRTSLHRQLVERLQGSVSDLESEWGRVVATVESVGLDTRPARDLAALSRSGGAPAILAGLLEDLEAGGPDVDQLMAEIQQAVRVVERSPAYLPVLEREERREENRNAVRAEVGRSALLLLDEMLAQKEAAS